MRIPYPERISYAWATGFAVALTLAQILQHTDPIFALCCFCYILIATIAFNLAGGLYRPAGAFIFFNAILCLLLGLIVKVVLDEPANSNLLSPTRTIEAYLLGMVGMLIAAYIENRFRTRNPLITRVFPVGSLRVIYMGAVIAGVVFNLYLFTGPAIYPGTVLSMLRNNNFLIPFAVLVGTISAVQQSNGKRATTPLLLGIIIFASGYSFLTYSKQDLFTTSVCWMLGAGIARYKLKPSNLIVMGLMAIFAFYVGVPIIQLGKARRSPIGVAGNVAVSMDMFTHFEATKKEYEQNKSESYGRNNYFDHPEGLFDRLQMISVDDKLITEADHNGFYGYASFIEGWENMIPHFIWKDKPVPTFGNTYGHLIGLIGPNDMSTSISFSPTGDAYEEGGFTGVLIMETFCFIVIFLALSFALGDLRGHPAVIILILVTAHYAPEGLIPGLIEMLTFTIVALEFALFCRYIFPVASSALLPPESNLLPDVASTID